MGVPKAGFIAITGLVSALLAVPTSLAALSPIQPVEPGNLVYEHDGGIWSASADGEREVRLYFSGRDPAWSPDGRAVAFVQDDVNGSSSSIQVVKSDATDDYEVYDTSDTITGVDWSPTGDRLVFTSEADDPDKCDSPVGSMHTIGTDGSGAEVLVEPKCARGLSDPAFSPDGSQVAFTEYNGFIERVGVVDADGGQILDGLKLQSDLTRLAAEPAWAPDGSRLATWHEAFDGHSTLSMVSVDGLSVRNLPADGRNPSWSPDGSWLAFDHHVGIWVAGSDGSDPREVLDHGRNVDWRPGPGAFDGSWYAMVSGEGKVHAYPSWHGWADPALFGRAVDLVIAPDGGGYFVLDETGFVHGVGSGARSMGSIGNQLRAGERPVALTINDDAQGGYVLSNQGQAFHVGDADPIPDVRDLALQGEIVDAVAADGGVLAAAADGGVFALNTEFHGSAAQLPLQGPITTIVADADGNYSLFADDGGVFNYGSEFKGSLPGLGIKPNEPIVTGVAYGDGYVLFARDAGAFVFSNKAFQGSGGADPAVTDIVSGDAHADNG